MEVSDFATNIQVSVQDKQHLDKILQQTNKAECHIFVPGDL